MWLFVAFLAVPLIEIGLFIQVGGAIGLWPTLGIVILTAIIGTSLVRSQGIMALSNLRNSFSRLDDPTEHLAHGAMILLAGALLLTPGFFTDGIGFALLVPPVRKAVFNYLRKHVHIQKFNIGGTGQARPQDRDVIDGEFHELDPDKPAQNKPSGWTKH